jgi:hypothetical protein
MVNILHSLFVCTGLVGIVFEIIDKKLPIVITSP